MTVENDTDATPVWFRVDGDGTETQMRVSVRSSNKLILLE